MEVKQHKNKLGLTFSLLHIKVISKFYLYKHVVRNSAQNFYVIKVCTTKQRTWQGFHCPHVTTIIISLCLLFSLLHILNLLFVCVD